MVKMFENIADSLCDITFVYFPSGRSSDARFILQDLQLREVLRHWC